jgi:hypothetical protein
VTPSKRARSPNDVASVVNATSRSAKKAKVNNVAPLAAQPADYRVETTNAEGDAGNTELETTGPNAGESFVDANMDTSEHVTGFGEDVVDDSGVEEDPMDNGGVEEDPMDDEVMEDDPADDEDVEVDPVDDGGTPDNNEPCIGDKQSTSTPKPNQRMPTCSREPLPSRVKRNVNPAECVLPKPKQSSEQVQAAKDKKAALARHLQELDEQRKAAIEAYEIGQRLAEEAESANEIRSISDQAKEDAKSKDAARVMEKKVRVYYIRTCSCVTPCPAAKKQGTGKQAGKRQGASKQADGKVSGWFLYAR